MLNAVTQIRPVWSGGGGHTVPRPAQASESTTIDLPPLWARRSGNSSRRTPSVNVVSGRRSKNVPNTGTIKKVVEDRGFGFITGADGNEYFFHRNGVEGFETLRGGESVTFEIEQSDKGPRANQVKVTSN
jgi:CspA family cold shock protein